MVLSSDKIAVSDPIAWILELSREQEYIKLSITSLSKIFEHAI